MKQLSSKQVLSFTESTAKINIWEGAVRSGKTYISLMRWLKELMDGDDGEYCMISRTYDSFKRNLLPLIFDMIGADSRFYIGKRELVIWGKTIHCVSADDEASEKKIRGSTFSGAYVDEATIIPESCFKMLVSRCAMGNAKIFATTNPDSPFHWLKRDYLTNNQDVKSWQFTLADNPVLTQVERDYLCRQYKGLWYKRFIEGLWVQAEGSIYDMFDASLHTISVAPALPEYCIIGCDYGTANPCAFVSVSVNQSKYPNLWVDSEYYWDSKAQQRQKTDSEYCADLKQFIAGRPVRAIYIDPSAASFKLECQRAGIPFIMDAENEVLDGIRMVGKYLDNGTLKIMSHCTELIKEIQSYVWDPKSQRTGEDSPLKSHDHAVDALRYSLYTHFFNKPTTRLNAQDIDALYNEAQGNGLPRMFQDPYSQYR